MTWRLKIEHRTGYKYASEVTDSYNEARLTPLTTPSQTVIESRVDVRPVTRLYHYWDYWGSVVHGFDIHTPHTELIVKATSVVETSAAGLDTATFATWESIGDASARDDWCEYLLPSAFAPADDELTEIATGLRAASNTPADAVFTASDWVREQLSYEKGSTTSSTNAVEAWRQGQGVCQDFVHLMLDVLRSMGIPARYVSGYLYPAVDGRVGDPVRGESHAWVDAWTGEWRATDPTNGMPVGERHVVVARGRDYADVAPLRGIYNGSASSDPNVDVELTRLS